MIKHVIWSSMIDYPGHTSAVLFTGTCNFNCSYCYNRTLRDEQDKSFDELILPKLIQRKDFVKHVIVSGGEPTIDEDFNHIINTLHKEGFTIGIHTNGSNPEKVKEYIDKISYFGVDVKSSKEKYNDITGVNADFDKIEKTIDLIIKKNKAYEFRTTLFPKHVEKEDALNIAKWLKDKGVKRYHLQQFYVVNSAEDIKPYSLKEINNITEECNKIITTVLKTK